MRKNQVEVGHTYVAKVSDNGAAREIMRVARAARKERQ